MDNTNRLELIISVKDDGSVVIDQVRKKAEGLGKATKQYQEQLRAQRNKQ
jgi:hypothetical protein